MKTVLISGASRGIGASIAEIFAKNGYNVAVNYCSSKEKARDLCINLEKSYKVRAEYFKADAGDYNQVKSMVEKVMETFQNVDVLVNNAGRSLIKLITQTEKEEWDDIIASNLTSVFNMTSNVLPHMIRKHEGCIINISSMWGECGASCEVAYSASKAGVIGFTKALAKEVGLSGIRVNCISPGVIMTDMNSELDETIFSRLKEDSALNRLGKPEDVAKTVYFLSTEDASFITGQVIGVNGGILI